MITELCLYNFKSFDQKKIHFPSGFCNVVGENGVGKTNILQGIWIASGHPLPYGNEEGLHKMGTYKRFLELKAHDKYGIPHTLSIAHDRDSGRKVIMINGKNTTKSMLEKIAVACVYFSPYDMNLFYLGPKYRREFLYSLLNRTSTSFKKNWTEYETILKHRNKVLKYLQEGKGNAHDLEYWDEQFIQKAKTLYDEIFPLVQYFKDNIDVCASYVRNFSGKVEFLYHTKVHKESLESDLTTYLENNLQRDIILARTPIGPHVDDFDLTFDGLPILSYASRGELKSVLLELKFLEINYIKTKKNQNPVVLIDDILSELDAHHLDEVLNKCFDLQIIATSISPILKENITVISL